MHSQLHFDKILAFLDGPDSPDISNPIHSTAGAANYGFKGALVGGATVFGWATPLILETMGTDWLRKGWASISFRRPTYPGEELTISLEPTGPQEFLLRISGADGDDRLKGEIGIGMAPWLSEIVDTEISKAAVSDTELPLLTLSIAPIGQTLSPLGDPLSVPDAISYGADKQRSKDELFVGEKPIAHPGWICARPIRFLHHSYNYSPAIHAKSQIQFFGEIHAGENIVTTGTFVEAYERKGHTYGVVDCSTFNSLGVEVIRQRHTTIFAVGARE